jgi:hypothetical protein
MAQRFCSVVVLCVGLLGVWAAQAGASTGFLDPLGCIGLAESAGACSDAVADDVPGMRQPKKLVVAPNGRDAYGVSSDRLNGANVVTHFHRNAAGRLTFADCVSDVGGTACAVVPAKPIETLTGIIVSPDGGDVYTSSFFGESIARFSVNADGSLRYAGCLGYPDAGCTPLSPEDGRGQVTALDESADGHDVYWVTDDDTTVHARRLADGSLSARECLGSALDCASAPSFIQPTDLLVSPTGRSIYVTGNGIIRLRRAADGTISYADCVADNQSICSGLSPGTGTLFGSEALSITPDGGDLYVTSESRSNFPGDLVDHFHAAPDGALQFRDCVGSDQPGCPSLPPGRVSVSFPRSTAVSGDGKNLYVDSMNNGTLLHFDIGSDGALTYASCVGVQITCFPAYVSGSDDQSISASPDGHSVYLGVQGGFGEFARVAAPVTQSGEAPSITAKPAFNIGPTSAAVAATYDVHGQPNILAFEYGPTPGYGSYETIWEHLSPTTVDGEFSGLQPQTTYHARLVITTPAGTFRGPDTTFTTTSRPNELPVIDGAGPLGSVGPTSSRLYVGVNPNGSATTYRLEYGTSTSYGSQTPSSPAPVGADTTTHWMNRELTGLTPGTTYHFRVVATNVARSVHSTDSSFTTRSADPPPPPMPMVRSGQAATTGPDSATLHGVLNPEGHDTRYHFEYGPMRTWSDDPDRVTTPERDAGDGSADINASVAAVGLTPGTTYHYRLVVDGPLGPFSGGDRTFVAGAPAPPPAGPIDTPPADAPGDAPAAPVGIAAPVLAPPVVSTGSPGPALVAKVAVARHVRLATLMRGLLPLRVSCSQACDVGAALLLQRGRAPRRLGSIRTLVPAGRAERLWISLSPGGRRLLRTTREAHLSLQVAASHNGATWKRTFQISARRSS